MMFRGTDLDKQVRTTDGRTSLPQFSTRPRLLATLAAAALLCLSFSLNVQLVGTYGLTIHLRRCRRNGKRPLFLGHDNIGVGDRRRTGDVTVCHLPTRLRRRAWPHQHLQPFRYLSGTEPLHFTGVYRIGQPELFAYGNLRRCTSRHRLCRGNEQRAMGNEHCRQQSQCPMLSQSVYSYLFCHAIILYFVSHCSPLFYKCGSKFFTFHYSLIPSLTSFSAACVDPAVAGLSSYDPE